jgi:tripartite ATP-independent transporter DctP family solute receptor
MTNIKRRSVLMGASALAMTVVSPLMYAESKVELILSDTFPETDRRAKLLTQEFGPALGSDFDFKPYWNASLFKQGTELLAMQRGNLDLCNLSVPDFQRQIPAWGIVGAPYIFRDIDHMQKVFASDVGQQLFKMAEEKLGVKVLSVSYIGMRHVNLKPKKKVMTPADLAGFKLRMPAGEGWQFMATALGANPTPIAYTEVYTALQTGAIDGQDNPLPNDKDMKFYEVTTQIVLTGHMVNFNLFTLRKSKWDALTQTQKDRLQKAADAFAASVTSASKKEEEELIAFFKAQGLDVYTPNVKAFRDYAVNVIKKSKYVNEWIPGMLDRISTL